MNCESVVTFNSEKQGWLPSLCQYFHLLLAKPTHHKLMWYVVKGYLSIDTSKPHKSLATHAYYFSGKMRLCHAGHKNWLPVLFLHTYSVGLNWTDFCAQPDAARMESAVVRVECKHCCAPWKRVAPGICLRNVHFYNLTVARDRLVPTVVKLVLCCHGVDSFSLSFLFRGLLCDLI